MVRYRIPLPRLCLSGPESVSQFWTSYAARQRVEEEDIARIPIAPESRNLFLPLFFFFVLFFFSVIYPIA